MQKIKSLALDDLKLITEYLSRYPPEISELTFSNLFAWQHSRPVSYLLREDSLIFLVRTANDQAAENILFGPPIGDISILGLRDLFGEKIAGAIRISEKSIADLQNAGIRVDADRANADYVYRVSDLAELAGRHYAKKRNKIKQCLQNFSCEYEPISTGLVTECLAMQKRWCAQRECGRNTELCNEYTAIREMLSHFNKFTLLGGAIRVEGVIQAYTIGERLSPDTAVCHFEKAMTEYSGLSQLINHWFARFGLTGFTYVNREQDLDIPGLRQAKESYYPDHMVNKYTAVFNEESFRIMTGMAGGCPPMEQ